MANFETIFQERIIDKLTGISIANEFENDITYLNGYITFYLRDLLDPSKPDLSFPCVGSHYLDEDITNQSRAQPGIPANLQGSRRFRVELGIDVHIDRNTILSRQESLVRDVKKALLQDGTGNLTLERVEFEPPSEQLLEYSFIVITGSIKYNEKY